MGGYRGIQYEEKPKTIVEGDYLIVHMKTLHHNIWSNQDSQSSPDPDH